MDWASGITATYKAFTVDSVTWEDIDEVPLMSGTVTRDMSDDLLTSASVDVREPVGETWLRIYLIAEQNGGAIRVPLFTGLTATPTRTLDGTRESYKVDCYSRLKVASDKMVPLGYYVAAGARGTDTIIQLLQMANINATAPITSTRLTDYIIAESGETVLTMAQKVARAIGWQIRLDGRGTVTIEPQSNEIRGHLSNDIDIMEPSVSDTDDWYSCPNVLRVTSGTQTATVYDRDPESDLSVQARGREIWAQESVTLSDASALPTYARARLKALQQHTRTLSYSRRFNPGIMPGDLVAISYPQAGLTGNFRVMSQTIALAYGARTQEEVYYEP